MIKDVISYNNEWFCVECEKIFYGSEHEEARVMDCPICGKIVCNDCILDKHTCSFGKIVVIGEEKIKDLYKKLKKQLEEVYNKQNYCYDGYEISFNQGYEMYLENVIEYMEELLSKYPGKEKSND